MNIRIGEKLLQIDGARIAFRNFSGAATKYTREGTRTFSVIIPDMETAEKLKNDVNEYGIGWNVKIKPPRDEQESPFIHLSVKVNYDAKIPPKVYLKTGDKVNPLDEESISMLDNISIENVDLDIRAYDDDFSGRPFRAAYLKAMWVTQDLNSDRFSARFADYNAREDGEDDGLPF